MHDLTLQASEQLSFEEAIALTQTLLDRVETDTISNSEQEQTVRALVSSETGARGFFVTYLSDDRALADQLLPVVAVAVQAAPTVTAPLLVKNLAMSTAMAILHRRNQNEELAQGSDRVRSRTAQLIQTAQFPELQEQAHTLANSIRTGEGEYRTFLKRWGYDLEQQQAIYAALEQINLV